MACNQLRTTPVVLSALTDRTILLNSFLDLNFKVVEPTYPSFDARAYLYFTREATDIRGETVRTIDYSRPPLAYNPSTGVLDVPVAYSNAEWPDKIKHAYGVRAIKEAASRFGFRLQSSPAKAGAFQAIKGADVIDIEITPSGLIKSKTKTISHVNHDRAGNFLERMSKLAGGTVTEKSVGRGQAHAHEHHGIKHRH